MVEEKGEKSTDVKGIDIGITRGGSKEVVLQDHFYSRRKLADLVCNVDVPLDVKRIKTMVMLHASSATNEHFQNQIREMFDEKAEEELRLIQTKHGYKTIDDIPVDIQQDVLLDVCVFVESMITKYMDRFIGLEDRYEVILA